MFSVKRQTLSETSISLSYLTLACLSRLCSDISYMEDFPKLPRPSFPSSSVLTNHANCPSLMALITVCWNCLAKGLRSWRAETGSNRSGILPDMEVHIPCSLNDWTNKCPRDYWEAGVGGAKEEPSLPVLYKSSAQVDQNWANWFAVSRLPLSFSAGGSYLLTPPFRSILSCYPRLFPRSPVHSKHRPGPVAPPHHS